MDAYAGLVGALAHHFADVLLAEELAHEALAKAARNWKSVQAMSSPAAWCYRVGVNQGNSWLRRRSAERRAMARLGATRAAGEADSAQGVALRAAVGSLSRRQREAVVLRFYIDLTVSETASLLGMTPGAVRALTHRAVINLRDALGEELVADGVKYKERKNA